MSANRTDKKEIDMIVAELVPYLDDPQLYDLIERTVRTLEEERAIEELEGD
jgi:hypothetical protein